MRVPGCSVGAWLLQAVLVMLHVARLRADVHSPCLGCRLFNMLQQQHPDPSKQDTVWCHYPCQCPLQELKCKDGVGKVKDGCGCCFMCGRQQGDLCTPQATCDTTKDLTCRTLPGNETGICKGRVQNPCFVDGVTYKDGQQFQPDCARICTCQNGYYGCVSTCPEAGKPPSEATCHNPRLLPVAGKCCKEWTCEKMEAAPAGGSILDGTRGLESDNLILQYPFYYLTTPRPHTTTMQATPKPHCLTRPTDWSPCSVTCDVGVSVRLLTDPETCEKRQERRLCLLRPCGQNVETHGRDKCTPTTRSPHKQHVQYMDCLSLRQYRLKFCTTCREPARCCYPQRVRTRSMRFQCLGGERQTLQFMWIKKCRCDLRCYRSDTLRLRKRKAQQQERRRRRRLRAEEERESQGRGQGRGQGRSSRLAPGGWRPHNVSGS